MKSRWQRDGRALSEWMLGQTEQSGSLMRCDCMTMSKYPPNNSMKADSSSGQVGVYKHISKSDNLFWPVLASLFGFSQFRRTDSSGEFEF